MMAGAGGFIVLFLIKVLVVQPFSDRLGNISVQVKADEDKMGRLLYMDSQRGKITEFFDSIRPYLEIGRTEEDAFSVIMKKVEEIAKSCGVTLIRMKPETPEGKTKEIYKRQKVALDIEGSGNDIIRFFYELENNDYPMKVDRLDFKVKNRDTNLMAASLDVHFIYFL